MSPTLQVICAIMAVAGVIATVAGIYAFTSAPELAPGDPDGLSDREREELRVIRDHEEQNP